MRLVYIMGMPAGGTSAAAGTLYKNKYWLSGHTTSFECPEGYEALAGWYSHKTGYDMPDKGPGQARAKDWFDAYKDRAANEGYDKCLMKTSWMPIWCPEIALQCGVDPVLVWRDPAECARSYRGREELQNLPKDISDEELLAHYTMGQARIECLHYRHGWPMWRFGKQAKHSDLEAAVGETMPVEYFDAEKIKS